MDKKTVYIGAAVFGLAVAAFLLLRRRLIVMRRSGDLIVPDFTFPPIDIGPFVTPNRDVSRYGGYYPCECGCSDTGATGSDFLAPAAAQNWQVGSSSDVPETGAGLPSENIGPAIYFSDLPNGRRGGRLH